MSDAHGLCTHCDNQELPLKIVPGREPLDPTDPNRYVLAEHTNFRSRPCKGSGEHPYMVNPAD